MTWMLPASIAILAATVVLAAAYGYLYAAYRERYLRYWAASCAFSSVRYVCLIAQTLAGRSPLLTAGYFSTTVLGAMLMVQGAALYATGRHSPRWAQVGAAGLAWGAVAPFIGLAPPIAATPVFFLLGAAYVFVGFAFHRAWPQPRPASVRLTSVLFVLWGVHQFDYPVLRFVDWFAPIGYLIGGVFALSTSIGIILVYFDRARKALAESERRWHFALEGAGDGLWDWDVRTNRVYFSPQWKAMLGYEDGEIGDRLEEWASRVHPDDKARCDADLERHLRGQTAIYQNEHRVRCKDGSYLWILDRGKVMEWLKEGKPSRVVGTHKDITERKRAEEALRARERELKRSQEVAHVGHWNWDTVSNKVTWSDEMHRIFGVDPEGFDGDLDDVIRRSIHPEDRERVRAANEAVIEKSQPAPLEYRVVRPDGSIRHVSAVPGDRVTDDQGHVVRLSGIVQDITEGKKAEDERDRLEAQLFQSQKMESIGRLAGGVAHDFNNMLSVILGHAELAQMRLAPQDPVRADLGEIVKAATRSADLTRQLLAFARKQTVNPKVLHLNDAVSGMLKMLQRLIGEDVDLVWKPGHEVGRVRVDPSQLDQILANLSVNARDAIEGVGTLTLETENVTLDETRWPGQPDFVPGDYVRLSVTDTGCGMAQEVLAHAFEPFFTTKGAGKGTGLGLATVFGIVRQNGGYVTVYSEPGAGSTFRIYLPRCGGEDAAPAERSPSETRGGTETILLVEDEAAILDAVGRMLGEAGYMVLAAQGPGEAVRIAGEHEGTIHLVLTDVVMPGMNGRDLVKGLEACRPGLRSLYMSGYTANVIAHRGVLDEGVNFIPKPLRREYLLRTVRKVLDE